MNLYTRKQKISHCYCDEMKQKGVALGCCYDKKKHKIWEVIVVVHTKKGGSEASLVPSLIKKTINGTWSFTFPSVLVATNIDQKKPWFLL
jgi:hypothetical protein